MKENTNEQTIEKNTMQKTEKSKKGVAKKVFLLILIGIMIFIIGCAGWVFIDKYIRKSPAPSLFGYSQFVVVSGSMSGTIEVGDIVLTRKTNDYKIGDIVTFLAPGDNIPTTHRIVMIDGEQIHTKGDAMTTADVLPITADDILGEVVGVIPKLGLLSKWVTEGGGFVYILAIVAIAVVAIILWDLSKSKQKTKKPAVKNLLEEQIELNQTEKEFDENKTQKSQPNNTKNDNLASKQTESVAEEKELEQSTTGAKKMTSQSKNDNQKHSISKKNSKKEGNR